MPSKFPRYFSQVLESAKRACTESHLTDLNQKVQPVSEYRRNWIPI